MMDAPPLIMPAFLYKKYKKRFGMKKQKHSVRNKKKEFRKMLFTVKHNSKIKQLIFKKEKFRFVDL